MIGGIGLAVVVTMIMAPVVHLVPQMFHLGPRMRIRGRNSCSREAGARALLELDSRSCRVRSKTTP